MLATKITSAIIVIEAATIKMPTLFRMVARSALAARRVGAVFRRTALTAVSAMSSAVSGVLRHCWCRRYEQSYDCGNDHVLSVHWSAFHSFKLGTPREICTPMAVNRRVLSALCLLFHQQGTENRGRVLPIDDPPSRRAFSGFRVVDSEVGIEPTFHPSLPRELSSIEDLKPTRYLSPRAA